MSALQAYFRMKLAEEDSREAQGRTTTAPLLGAGVGTAVGGGGGLIAAAHNNKELNKQIRDNIATQRRLFADVGVEDVARGTKGEGTAKSILEDMRLTSLKRDLPENKYDDQMFNLKRKLKLVDDYGAAKKALPGLNKKLLKSIGKHSLIGAGAVGGAGLLSGLAYNQFKD